MLHAIIFDFNGVLADDEAAHLHCFRQALAEHGLSLTHEEYYGRYLGMDERTCAATMLEARDGRVDPNLHHAITARKADLFRAHTARQRPPLFPGVESFVHDAARRCRLAIASGGRRDQIDQALAGTGIEGLFDVIVSADDVSIGKPDPAIYLHTLKRLNAQRPKPPLLRADECLVIEDSRAGIRAAKTAGMRVVAVVTTYPADQLSEADRTVPDLSDLRSDPNLWAGPLPGDRHRRPSP